MTLKGRLRRLEQESGHLGDFEEALCREAVRRLTDAELKALAEALRREEQLGDDAPFPQTELSGEERAAYEECCRHFEEVQHGF